VRVLACDGGAAGPAFPTEMRPEYWELLAANAENGYGPCLDCVVRTLLSQERENIACLLLFGGLVRDDKAIVGWSDIDLIVVFRDILVRNQSLVGDVIRRSQLDYDIRVDLTQLDLSELCDPAVMCRCYHSEILNALALRPGVSAVLYGELPPFDITMEQERLAALFYMDDTVHRLRRYLVESAVTGSDEVLFGNSVARVTRWVFSTVRAALRLFGIYSHPYEPSLIEVERLFPEIDLTLPRALVAYRGSPRSYTLPSTVFSQSEFFLAEFRRAVLKRLEDFP
jgi:predicted nucleotidyltransferase